MYRTDDPVTDFLRHDAEQSKLLDTLPVCVECDEPIQESFYFEINEECVCKRCLVNNHKRMVEAYI
jgi:formylmethanofuran dehydrogenase subunit E